MRVLSSSRVCSLSSNLGGSWPVSRAATLFAWSQAICTCLVSGNMSGTSRASASASGFNPLAFMCSAPLSSSVESVASSGTKVSIAIEYIVKLTGRLLQDNRTAPAPEHSAQSAGVRGQRGRIRPRSNRIGETSTMTATDNQRWQDTADRVELAELMHRYALAIDTAHFNDLREVFTADASVDFGSVDQYVEGATGVSGIEAIVGWFRTVLAPFPDVLHFMSNHVIDLDGDRARVRTCMHVMHMAMGGVYDAQAVRSPEGWRIRNLRLDERRFEEAAARLEAHMSRVDGGG